MRGNRERCCDGPANGLDERFELTITDRLADDGELVAAESGQGVARPDHLGEPLGHVDEQGVADSVTKSVVDRLERVEVQEQDDEALAAAPRPGEPSLDPIGQEGLVRQAGELIMQGLMLAILGEAFTLLGHLGRALDCEERGQQQWQEHPCVGVDRDDGDQRRQRQDGPGRDRVEPELLGERLPPALVLGQSRDLRKVDEVIHHPGQDDQSQVSGGDQVRVRLRPCAAVQDRRCSDDGQGVVPHVEEQLPRLLAGQGLAEQDRHRHQGHGRYPPPQVQGGEHEGRGDGDRVALEAAHHDRPQLDDDHEDGHRHEGGRRVRSELDRHPRHLCHGREGNRASDDRAHQPRGQEERRMPRARQARLHPGHPTLLSESNRSMAHGNGSLSFAQHLGHIITHSGAVARNATAIAQTTSQVTRRSRRRDQAIADNSRGCDAAHS